MEVRRLDGGVATCRYRGWEAYCRCGDVGESSPRALEVYCSRVDVEEWMYRDIGSGGEMQERRHSGMELWSYGDVLQA